MTTIKWSFFLSVGKIRATCFLTYCWSAVMPRSALYTNSNPISSSYRLQKRSNFYIRRLRFITHKLRTILSARFSTKIYVWYLTYNSRINYNERNGLWENIPICLDTYILRSFILTILFLLKIVLKYLKQV